MEERQLGGRRYKYAAEELLITAYIFAVRCFGGFHSRITNLVSEIEIG